MYVNIESLLRPLTIGPIKALNRLMRSATYESSAEPDGTLIEIPTTRIYRDLAAGGIGLIITGHIFVHENGRASPKQIGLATGDQAAGWKSVLEAVRAVSKAPVLAQLSYAGRQGYTRGNLPEMNRGDDYLPPVGTSINDFTVEQLQHVVECFVAAARRAADVGFDGVQLHLAHGYLLSEALSAHTNGRQDEWGGVERADRRRLPLAVVDGVREAIGSGLALAVKLNGHDYLPPDGVEPGEAAETAGILEKHGVQLIEVSAGMFESGNKTAQRADSPETEGYLRDIALQVSRGTNVPLATVGGYRSVPVMLQALNQGLDMISLSRPLVREPDLPNLISRDGSHVATCTSCNRCFRVPQGALRCMVDHPEPLE